MSDPILLSNIVVSSGVVIISLGTVALGWWATQELKRKWTPRR